MLHNSYKLVFIYFTSGCIYYAAFNTSGNEELTWETLGGCEVNEYCNTKTKRCEKGISLNENIFILRTRYWY